MKLVYGINDKPKFGATIVFALQQLLAIMAATLVVPVIVGHGMQPAAALLGAGIGTLVYVLFTLRKSPVFLGSSFAFLGSMAAAFAGGVSMQLGYLGLILGAIFAGLVYVVIAIIVKFAGVNWINKLMPAVIIGSTVAIIGLSLAGNAIGDLQKVNYSYTEGADAYETVVSYNYVTDKDGNETYFDGSNNLIYIKNADGSIAYYANPADKELTVVKAEDKDFAALSAKLDNQAKTTTAVDKNGAPIGNVTANKAEDTYEHTGFTKTPGSNYVAIICGLITLIVTTLCATFGKKMIKLIPFIIGILSGYAAAVIFYFIGDATGNEALQIINFAPLQNLFKEGVTFSTFFTVPDFTFMTAIDGFGELNATYVSSIAVAYIPVAFVVFAEHIADHKNISTIVEKDLLVDPGLSRTLLGDGIGSMVGAFFGGCPNTTYGESIGCVAISGNASVITIIVAAVMAILIAFISPFVAFVNSIPSCVMGGVCVALYGFIAVSGLKMLQKVDLEENKNLFVASTILVCGVGGLSIAFGEITITTIACALILGIIINIILSSKKDKASK